MGIKRVKNKKTGKVYVYNYYKGKPIKSNKRNESFFTKSGSKRQGKGLNKQKELLIKELMNSNYSKEEANEITNDIVNDFYNAKVIYDIADAKKKNWTASQIAAKINKNKLFTMLSNTGYDVDEIAEYMDVSVSDLLDKDNWDDTVFTFKNKTFKVNFGLYKDTDISKIIEKVDKKQYVNLFEYMDGWDDEYRRKNKVIK